MLKSSFLSWTISIVFTALGMGVVSGQEYPNRPIRIVTAAVGGGGDLEARLIAQGISGPLGQQVIVENRGGSIGGAEIVARGVPEGYTLLIDTSSLWLGSLMQSTSYDPVRDFAPITLLARSTNVLVVHPSVAARSTKELIALAKSKPGTLNFGTSSTGGTPHLAAELFKAMAAVNIVRVPYKGGAAAAAGVVGGEVQVYFGGGTAVGRFHKSGQLRALAVTSATPSALFPDLPTVAATVPGYEAVGLSGIFAPAKTPAPVIRRLNQEIVRFLKTADAKEKYLNSGAEVVGSSPEELAVTIKSNMALWGKVIKDAGIKVQ